MTIKEDVYIDIWLDLPMRGGGYYHIHQEREVITIQEKLYTCTAITHVHVKWKHIGKQIVKDINVDVEGWRLMRKHERNMLMEVGEGGSEGCFCLPWRTPPPHPTHPRSTGYI